MEPEIAAGRPNRRPTHPGELLRDVTIPATGRPVSEIAALLGITRQQFHRVLSGESAVSPAMAHRLGKLCGNGPGIWARMQLACDLWDAERELGDALDAIPTLYPYPRQES